MFTNLTYGLTSLLFINLPSIAFDLSTQTTYWVGGKIYRYYFPEIKDTDLLKIEIDKLRFELDELKYNWVII